ncbi:hypothetical protein [Streptomyces sp. DSM 40907]|uniref:hypothetical protein n=1 Tax=Streptomyces kutzneri TaxID=3051179 RepID=UPI0028D6FD6F|nr:hypothetical protein [Streptomyces sp. DSM 40907]
MAEGPLTLNPADRRVEVETNTWLLSTGEEGRASLSVTEVVAAFHRAAAAIRGRVHAMGHRGVATFYVWHDAQAGQLRCSTGSVPPEALPFGSLYAASDDLDAIVAEFLAEESPGFVLWSDLEDVENQAEQAETVPEIPLSVWVSDVGDEAGTRPGRR